MNKFQVGQQVIVRHSRFGKREIIATVHEVRANSLRIHYSDPATRSSGACVVKIANVRPT